MFWSSALNAFVIAFASLFPIINPIGSAVLYSRVAQAIAPQERQPIALRIGFNVCIVLIVATWAGTMLLQLFGVGIGALRIAGGLVISVQAWQLLADIRGEDVARAQGMVQSSRRLSLIPLTIPFTTGPGSLAAAMTIGSLRPVGTNELIAFAIGTLGADVVLACLVGLLYASADWIVTRLGEQGARALTSLSSLLLLCIGMQILVQGLHDTWISNAPS